MIPRNVIWEGRSRSAKKRFSWEDEIFTCLLTLEGHMENLQSSLPSFALSSQFCRGAAAAVPSQQHQLHRVSMCACLPLPAFLRLLASTPLISFVSYLFSLPGDKSRELRPLAAYTYTCMQAYRSCFFPLISNLAPCYVCFGTVVYKF